MNIDFPAIGILEEFRVQDLLIAPSRVRVVFLLESPHIEEVKARTPLSGSAGINTMQYLAGLMPDYKRSTPEKGLPSRSLGSWIRDSENTDIGIMNCSEYPMGKSFYAGLDIPGDSECGSLVRSLETLRTNPGSITRRSLFVRNLELLLLSSVQARLEQLPEGALIIPCGAVARCFLHKIKGSWSGRGLSIYQKRVPHPSRGQWQNGGLFENEQSFKQEISERLRIQE